MKNIFTYLFLTLLSINLSCYKAQTCTIDYSYTQPGVYPDSLSTGYVSTPYSEDVTFVMILDTMGATITNFQILNIALPVGLSWQCDNAAAMHAACRSTKQLATWVEVVSLMSCVIGVSKTSNDEAL